MRKFTFLIASIVAGAFINVEAQTYDVGCSDIPSHPNNTTVYPNVPTQVQYTRNNYGATVTSSVVDSFTMEVSINGNRWTAFYRNMSAPFGTSASETIAGATAIDWSKFGLSAGSVALCVSTKLWSGGANIDANTSNDETCHSVNYTGNSNPFTYDIAIDSARIEAPHFSQGSGVPMSTFMTLLGFNIINDGNNDIPAGVGFGVDVTIDGTPYGPFNGSTVALSANGGLARFQIDAVANPMFLPSQMGAFDICVTKTATSDDINSNNDSNCGTYYMGQVGIEQIIEEDQIDVFYASKELHIDFLNDFNEDLDLNIVSINGQMIQSTMINANEKTNHIIDLNNVESGVYIANVRNNANIVKSIKFVVE